MSTASPERRWEEIKHLFDEVADLDAPAREAHLAAYGDSGLVSEVRSLLSWDEASTGFLESPPVQVASLVGDTLVGESLGPWRIVSVIGQGGMGVVYRAERADATFTRQAALKVIGPNAAAAGVVERFERERQTLADLDHRNIARLLDGGSTPSGQPYLVMEFVDGQRIDHYSDERRLSIDDRLELFLRVCNGVKYAHENLVLHRDIKPDNILVTADGTPKLLDFGVSRLLAPGAPTGDDWADTSATWLMTPDFASPEQMAGKASTTGSDVYSLGVVLYVLLTGERPYRLRGSTPAEILAGLSERVLTAPSTRVQDGEPALERAAKRGVTPAALARTLAGDLDAIVAKALALSPAERYPGVADLTRDVKAYRALLPVSAHASTPGYVAAKFVRRHRKRVIAAALFALLHISGVTFMVWQATVAATERARAERRFNDVRQLANVFMFDIEARIADVPGTLAARELIVKTAVDYLDSLARESASDPGLQRELARAWIRVGNVQGNPTNANLGKSADAMRSFRRATELAESARRASSGDVDALRTLATAHRNLGDVLALTGDTAGAVEANGESTKLFDTVAQSGGTLDDRIEAAIARIKRGDLLGNPNLPNAGRTSEAEAAFTSALAAFRQLGAEHPDDWRVQRFVGLSLERLGTLHETAQRWQQAEAAYRESFELRRALAAREPGRRNVQRDLAVAYEKLGKVEGAMGRGAAGIRNLRNALAQFDRLAAADGADVNATRSAAISREVLASALRNSQDLAEARQLFEAALTTHQALAELDTGNTQARCDVARLHEFVGDTLRAQAAPLARACEHWRRSVTALEAQRAAGSACRSARGGTTSLDDKLRACS